MAQEAKDSEQTYLSVGMEVSAKFKGAFCEAKIKSIQKIVKCKVNFKQSGESLTLPDHCIKGPLKTGGQILASREDTPSDYHAATIAKITDHSQYTVVFNDGDEKTLKRTFLRVKGERHFLESETLNNSPLTHPEHFLNPVKGPPTDCALKLTVESDSSDSDSQAQPVKSTLHDSDDELEAEKRDSFVAHLLKFMDERDTPMNSTPQVLGKHIDLYRLFIYVKQLGGYTKVTNRKEWNSVYRRLELPQAPTSQMQANSVNSLKVSYRKWLQPYEEFRRKLGAPLGVDTPVTIGAESQRSLQLFKSRLSEAKVKKCDVKEATSASSSEQSSRDSSPGRAASNGCGEEVVTLQSMIMCLDDDLRKEKSAKKKATKKAKSSKNRHRERRRSKEQEKKKAKEKETKTESVVVNEDGVVMAENVVESPSSSTVASKSPLLSPASCHLAVIETKASTHKFATRRINVFERQRKVWSKRRKISLKSKHKMKKLERHHSHHHHEPETEPKRVNANDTIKSDEGAVEHDMSESKTALNASRSSSENSSISTNKASAKSQSTSLSTPVSTHSSKSLNLKRKLSAIKEKDSTAPLVRKSVDSSTTTTSATEIKEEANYEPNDGCNEGPIVSGKANNNSMLNMNDISTTNESQNDDEMSSGGKTEGEFTFDDLDVNSELDVRYGDARHRKHYRAKILKLEPSNEKAFVHYFGWNTRYDEWIDMYRIVKIYTSDADSLFKKRRSSVTSSTKKKHKHSSPSNKSPVDVKSEPKTDSENMKIEPSTDLNSSEETIACKKPRLSSEQDSDTKSPSENSNEIEAIDSNELSIDQPILKSIKTEMIDSGDENFIQLDENSDSNSSAERHASMSNDTLIKCCESVTTAAPVATISLYTRKKRILESFKAASQSPPHVAAEPVELKRKSDSSVDVPLVSEVAVKQIHSASSLPTSKYELFKPTIKSPDAKLSGSSGSLTQLVSFSVGTPASTDVHDTLSASNVLSERMTSSTTAFQASVETLSMSNNSSSLLCNVNMDLSNDSGNMIQISEKCEISVGGEDKPESSVADKTESELDDTVSLSSKRFNLGDLKFAFKIIDKNIYGEERIRLIEDQMKECRKAYLKIKQEISSIDRKRKKHRKKLLNKQILNQSNSKIEVQS